MSLQKIKIMTSTSLYIHMPWCIQKCPYCDFNSHKSPEILPEQAYIDALLADLAADLSYLPPRNIQSIFIGGGTPSLFSAESYARLFSSLKRLLPFAKDIEITLEANPGSVEQQRFHEYRALGINRLSLGIQSFNPGHLKRLGRIHDDKQAHLAIETAFKAGFTNLNLDLMYNLPGQDATQGLEDLRQALNYKPQHLSWYELTIEPNTLFYKRPPKLPNEDESSRLEEEGLALILEQGLERYEISAFCAKKHYSRHNLNYWLFGDYYGIGAGAHGKIRLNGQESLRTQKQRQPKDYLNPNTRFLVTKKNLAPETLVFEFMLNTTRLEASIANSLFSEQTGLAFELLEPGLIDAEKRGLIHRQKDSWQVSSFGRRFTNELQALFLTSVIED